MISTLPVQRDSSLKTSQIHDNVDKPKEKLIQKVWVENPKLHLAVEDGPCFKFDT